MGEIGIDPKGTGYVAFIMDDARNRRELTLTESQVLAFSRFFPTMMRRILRNKLGTNPDIAAYAAVQVTEIYLNEDLHQTDLVLQIQDEAGGDFDFRLSPAKARWLAERLLARADKIESLVAKPPQ